MHVSVQFPSIKEYPKGFPVYWRKLIFNGSPSLNAHVNALAHTYIRLVEAALTEYCLGGMRLQEFWDTQNAFALDAINRSVSHFESCVTTMHRAINCFKCLRNHKSDDPLSVHIRKTKPQFAKDRVSSQLRKVRDAIHHLDELLLKGKIAEGQPIALRPEGFEVPHPSEADQVLKTFDRLAIGEHEIPFRDLSVWLREMAEQADFVAQFNRS